MPESDKRPASGSPEGDAKGQSENRHKGGGNSGLSNADPRVTQAKVKDPSPNAQRDTTRD